MAQVLTETFDLKPGTFSICEDADQLPKGVLKRIGPFPVSEAGVRNANGRRYSESLWKGVCEDSQISAKVQQRRMMGELDHPDTDRPTKLEHVSHVIPEMFMKGNKVFQTFEILDTPKGRIASSLIDAKVPVGVSTRGFGETQMAEDGAVDVQEDSFVYETTDFVGDPSAGLFAQLPEEKKRIIRKGIRESIERDHNGVLKNYHESLLESLGFKLDENTSEDHQSSATGDEDMKTDEALNKVLEMLGAIDTRLTQLERRNDENLANLGDKKAKPFKKDKDGDGKTNEGDDDLAGHIETLFGTSESDDNKGDDNKGDEGEVNLESVRRTYEQRMELAEGTINELRDMVRNSAKVVEHLVAEGVKLADIVEKQTGQRPETFADQIRSKQTEAKDDKDDKKGDDPHAAALATPDPEGDDPEGDEPNAAALAHKKGDKKKDEVESTSEVAIGGGKDPDGQQDPAKRDPDKDKSSKDGYSLGGRPDPQGKKDPEGRNLPKTKLEAEEGDNGEASTSGNDDDPPAREGKTSETDDEEMDESAHPAFESIRSLVENSSRIVSGNGHTGGKQVREGNRHKQKMLGLYERTTGRKAQTS